MGRPILMRIVCWIAWGTGFFGTMIAGGALFFAVILGPVFYFAIGAIGAEPPPAFMAWELNHAVVGAGIGLAAGLLTVKDAAG